MLPAAFTLMIVEGHRPLALQEHYFRQYRSEVIEANPDLTVDEAYLLASRYVVPPDIAPHVSGAAIDLTLASEEGEELDLGSPVNATPEQSDGGCYFHASKITSEARHYRGILAHALEAVGLVNYPTEWWHWSYGDRYWAFLTKARAARFGPLAVE